MPVSFVEKRYFPRMDGRECPVLYLCNGMLRWGVGILIDMSATGIRLQCGEPLAEHTEIAVRVRPGSNRLVPAVQGVAYILRSRDAGTDQFELSCKFTRVEPPKA